MRRQLLILFGIVVFSGKLFSQCHTIEIPEFKNVDTSDKYPEYSNLRTYLDRFDLLISLKGYSAWGPDENIKVLAHHKFGWYKIEINTDHKNFGTFDAVCYLMFKVKDPIGDTIWKTLNENHLFDMVDERTKKMLCNGNKDTIVRNGKIEIVEQFYAIDDGPEYEFEILTPINYKKLYFYSPQYFNENCPGVDERIWIVNCIKIFEKHFGN